MDERFTRLDETSYGILCGMRPEQKVAVKELIDLWRKLHAQGMPAFDFAQAMTNVSQGVILHFDSLEEAEHFGQAQKEAGETLVRAVSTHWPPVNPDDLPR